MAVGLATHSRTRLHQTGDDHVEHPIRLELIEHALQAAGLLTGLVRLTGERAEPADAALVHDPAYVRVLELACDEQMGWIGAPDTRLSPMSYEAAMAALGTVLHACDAVVAGEVTSAFCLVRPPGHHAGRDLAGGFCLVNHVAVAAEHLIRRRGVGRVAIVDMDAHHGHGTQRIFEARSDVLYISLHESPTYTYPFTGHACETGLGEGAGYTLNIPLDPGTDGQRAVEAFDQIALPRLEMFGPDFVLVSAGFDGVKQDALSHLNFEPATYFDLSTRLARLANESCRGKLVSVLEGGYDMQMLGPCAAAHVQALLASDISA